MGESGGEREEWERVEGEWEGGKEVGRQETSLLGIHVHELSTSCLAPHA